MTGMTTEERISALSAKVTAMIMLIEALYVEELLKAPDPASMGQAITDNVLNAEKKAREKVGDTAYSLQISEAASSLIDRAVRRAVALKSKESPP